MNRDGDIARLRNEVEDFLEELSIKQIVVSEDHTLLYDFSTRLYDLGLIHIKEAKDE